MSGYTRDIHYSIHDFRFSAFLSADCFGTSCNIGEGTSYVFKCYLLVVEIFYAKFSAALYCTVFFVATSNVRLTIYFLFPQSTHTAPVKMLLLYTAGECNNGMLSLANPCLYWSCRNRAE